jgi:hypothetical protein
LSALIAGNVEALMSIAFIAADPLTAAAMIAVVAPVAAYYAVVC